jgi:lipopolysaccharide biosynthesis regulator YciM
MLHEEDEKAIECFVEYLKVNTKNLDAYIKLGALLRNNKQETKALNIHENLLFRQDLSKSQRLTILTQICEDNMALENFDKAIENAKEILRLEKGNRFATENLYKLFRDHGEWENSIEYLKKHPKIKSEKKNRMMTIYKVEEGLNQFYAKEKYHDARLIFRKAIKYDPNCEAPYYYMGLSYIKDKREEDAVDWWEKFVEVNPEKAYLVFPQLKKILFNLGQFEKINTFLRNILKKAPDNSETIIALAEFYENKGDIDQAIALIDGHLKNNPSDIKARISQGKFYAVKQDCRKSANILIDVLNDYNKKEILTCSNCGHKVKEPTWFCSNCKEIDTYL